VTAVSPAGTGTVDVTVTTPGGTSAVVAADQFTYGQRPVVRTIKPTQGTTKGGTSVTVIGIGLTGATQVLFGDAPAINVSVQSDTVVAAVTPAGSGTVPVTVTTGAGTSAPTVRFTYADG
jgi:hypothetical protein